MLKPDGCVILREHDCNEPELSYILDLQKGLHRHVWSASAASGTKESKKEKEYVQGHWAHYRPKEEWRSLFTEHGSMRLVDSNLGWLGEIGRTYFEVFQPHPLGAAGAASGGVVVGGGLADELTTRYRPVDPPSKEIKRVLIGPIPYDASLEALRATLYRFHNCESYINQSRLPPKHRLFGLYERTLVRRPVIVPLLGRVGTSYKPKLAMERAARIAAVGDVRNAEHESLLFGRIFDSKDAGLSYCKEYLPDAEVTYEELAFEDNWQKGECAPESNPCMCMCMCMCTRHLAADDGAIPSFLPRSSPSNRSDCAESEAAPQPRSGAQSSHRDAQIRLDRPPLAVV